MVEDTAMALSIGQSDLSVAGFLYHCCFRLRPRARPPSQPAFRRAEAGGQISVGNEAEPGNRIIEAGSAPAESLSEIGWVVTLTP